MRNCFHLPSNLSEKQVEADVASFLGWCSSGLPFRLLDIDEQKTGADKLFKSNFLVYIQFKKSSGLVPLKRITGAISDIQNIRKFRFNSGFNDNQILYFKLREKAKNSTDYQHNILKTLNIIDTSYGIYIAPLCLDKETYYNSLFSASVNRYTLNPFYFSNTKITFEDGIQIISAIPFIKNHISIIPHSTVSSANHYYSYSEVADNVCWHSGEILNENISRFSDFIMKIGKSIKNNVIKFPRYEIMEERLIKKVSHLVPKEILNSKDGLKLYNIGIYLKKEYDIDQYLFQYNKSES